MKAVDVCILILYFAPLLDKMVLEQLDSHMKKKKLTPTSHHAQNQSEMDYRSKVSRSKQRNIFMTWQ